MMKLVSITKASKDVKCGECREVILRGQTIFGLTNNTATEELYICYMCYQERGC